MAIRDGDKSGVKVAGFGEAEPAGTTNQDSSAEPRPDRHNTASEYSVPSQLENVEANLAALLSCVQLRPGMYIGIHDIHALAAFISGFSMAELCGAAVDCSVLENIHDWAAAKYGFRESTAGAYNIIHGCTPHGGDPLHNFFRDFAEFLLTDVERSTTWEPSWRNGPSKVSGSSRGEADFGVSTAREIAAEVAKTHNGKPLTPYMVELADSCRVTMSYSCFRAKPQLDIIAHIDIPAVPDASESEPYTVRLSGRSFPELNYRFVQPGTLITVPADPDDCAVMKHEACDFIDKHIIPLCTQTS